VAEWSIAPVLKTGGSQGPVSSNLTASASAVANRRPLGPRAGTPFVLMQRRPQKCGIKAMPLVDTLAGPALADSPIDRCVNAPTRQRVSSFGTAASSGSSMLSTGDGPASSDPRFLSLSAAMLMAFHSLRHTARPEVVSSTTARWLV
jgi:hypothetical protein